jgi:hypothetical protein
MISSRCNDNYDEFPAEEIERGYRSFIGKPVFVNHHNEDHRRARGVIIDAVLHKDANPDGSPDSWVEGLQEIDALTYPRLAKAIIAGDIDRTSMGVDVAYSICSVCANKATTPLEYCRHIPAMKGMKVLRRTADGSSRSELVRERCHGLSFFENSLLVEEPADPTAYFLGQVERGPGLEHLGQRSATHTTAAPARVYMHRGGPAYTQNTTAAGVQRLSVTHGGICRSCHGEDTLRFQGSTECLDCGVVTGPITHDASLTAPSMAREGKYSFDMRKNPEWKSDPGSHPIWHDLGASVNHIVHHWDQARPPEKADGKRWYPDAHLVAHHFAQSTGHSTHQAAGVLSAYSPKMEWGQNLHHAIRSLHEGRAITSAEGANVMALHTNAAQRIMDGEDHQQVLKGPKTNAFAHTIEHGGRDPQTGGPSHRVVVDTHAVSVMCGRRLSKEEKADAASAIGHPHFYQHAQSLYQQAAAHLSAREGREIAPHEVQATTWGVRKRINDEDEDFKNKGNQTLERKNREKWQDYHKEHTDSGFASESAEPGMRNMHARRNASSRGRRGRR